MDYFTMPHLAIAMGSREDHTFPAIILLLQCKLFVAYGHNSLVTVAYE